ncbi:3103_t:CDS:2 [Entrophospora sp. SA101]|nr:3103_t:CDS:2 [Entrophospora sp. SA101]
MKQTGSYDDEERSEIKHRQQRNTLIKAPPLSLFKPEVFILQVQPKSLKDCDDKTANIPKVIRENVINICQAMPQYYKNKTEHGDMFKLYLSHIIQKPIQPVTLKKKSSMTKGICPTTDGVIPFVLNIGEAELAWLLYYNNQDVAYMGYHMVIMEYVEAKTLFMIKDDLNIEYKKKVFKDIAEAKRLLHKNQLVFGDLRSTNILVTDMESSSPQGMLVDFDWGGKEGEAWYPTLQNTRDIIWPIGVGPDEYLMMEHDNVLYSWLEVEYGSCELKDVLQPEQYGKKCGFPVVDYAGK